MPPLRERGNDILLLFRKFATDFAEKYNMPIIRLDESGKQVALTYRWPGNVRQLRNITEQLSIIEQDRDIDAEILMKYLPDYKEDTHPAIMPTHQGGNADFASEREILYKVLFDMKNDIAELKKEMKDLIGGNTPQMRDNDDALYIPQDEYSPYVTIDDKPIMPSIHAKVDSLHHDNVIDTHEITTHQDSLSLTESEFNLIRKALERHNGKRKAAAQELGISERTLYRKLKEYNITR